MDYTVMDFVSEARPLAAAASDATVVQRVAPLLLRLAGSRSWTRAEGLEADPQQGFGVHVLHEEPDHSLWLVAVSWLPSRGAPPHNHGTWAVIAGVEGEEENVVWQYRGRELRPATRQVLGPGQVTAFLGDDIHSVANPGERPTLSLHVYGRNLNHVERSQFDAETGVATPLS